MAALINRKTSKVLVLSGPIASGKSTVAELVAEQFRSGRRGAAVIDLDRLYMMLDDGSPMADQRISREARRAAAALTDHSVLDGFELVIVEGTFWTQSERNEFTGRLTTPVHSVFVTLRVSVDEALRRVERDTTRRTSKQPDVLRKSHAEFGSAPPIPGDVTIESTERTVEDVASTITTALGGYDTSTTAAPLIRDVDCVQIPVRDLDAALYFYCRALDHALVWRTDTAAGLQLADSRTELVIQTERPELEPNLSVLSVDGAVNRIIDAGGALMHPPFDIAIGRCAVVQDPWGNRLVLLDHSKGRLLVDASQRVRVGPDGRLQAQADG